MKLVFQNIFKMVIIIITIGFFGCGQSIGYKEVESEIRYYHSTDPEWLPSAAGPGKSVYIKLKNVNRNKFKIFGIVAKDNQNVWYAGKPIIGADSESFEVLEGPYQKDKSTVYFNGKPIVLKSLKYLTIIMYMLKPITLYFIEKRH
ncbi:DKNYY domain-containing protein [Flavicella sp.]|uniref:DKNYY domain-containing protein n=1 Tax=Flavicella sp. TaxID=2957742 RepID=UPI0026077B8E|nr:DKNYY domain-containing protein [Flavicella sp.]MDG1806208.1 DKNYY domain-containing protein [Flavicella sp.]